MVVTGTIGAIAWWTADEMLAQLGRVLSQAAVARELRTGLSGTDWSDNSGYPVPDVLNMSQKRNQYVAVALPRHNGGGPHLAGHRVDQTIFHWFDIRGYRDYGTVTDILGARGYDW
jgi:hypothetical protein